MAYNKDYDENGNGADSSMFNEAFFQIQRLHASWTNCYKFRTQADYMRWRWELEYLWSELCTDAKRLNQVEWERNTYNITITALDKMISNAVKRNDGVLLYKYLDRKEKYLRYLQDKAGKGGSYKDETHGMF